MMEYSHVAYADESNHNASKFGSICLISGEKEFMELFEKDLGEILKSSDVSEFKFNQISSGKMIQCAFKILDKLFYYTGRKKIRVDVLIWSPEERGKNLPESSRKVFGKMYYHLLNNVLGLRWTPESSWSIYPDKQSLIDWDEMGKILKNTGSKIGVARNSEGKLIWDVVVKNDVRQISEVDSLNCPTCQVADLFAGIGASGYLRKENLTLHDDCQSHLGGKLIDHTNKDVGKIRVMNHLRKKCRDCEIKIDFSPDKGIRTIFPTDPINFWLFEHKMQRSKNKSLGDFLGNVE